MISLSSVWAVVLRHTRMWRRDPNILLCALYWPVLDILVWGFLGSWIAHAGTSLFDNYEITALLGILLWQVVGRGCNIMAFTFHEELWSNNVVNLFSLPLRIVEWMCGVVLYNAIVLLIMTSFCMLVMLVLYDVSLWHVLKTFLIFLPPLFLSSVWIGFTCLQIVITLGKRGVELGFVMAWFLLPFSGAYYPVEVLPKWGQMVSSFLSMSYVFQGMRGYLMHQQDPTWYLIKGYALSIVYTTCAVIFFMYCFNQSKHKGLARLTD